MSILYQSFVIPSPFLCHSFVIPRNPLSLLCHSLCHSFVIVAGLCQKYATVVISMPLQFHSFITSGPFVCHFLCFSLCFSMFSLSQKISYDFVWFYKHFWYFGAKGRKRALKCKTVVSLGGEFIYAFLRLPASCGPHPPTRFSNENRFLSEKERFY